jgi:hypothetical protein
MKKYWGEGRIEIYIHAFLTTALKEENLCS